MAGVSSVTTPTTTSTSPLSPTPGQGLIAASTGLVSGLQTQQIISALLTFDQEPVTDLNNQITTEKSKQSAYSTLSSQLFSLQNDAQQLTSSSVLGARTANSSNPLAITGSASAGAPLASYLVTPVVQAQTQEMLSNGFANTTSAPVGQGTITIKLGGFVNPSTPLVQLNGGQGVARGKISITDRSGASATVDLSAARTIDDVVNDINQTAGIHVQASISGDSLVINDTSGVSGPKAGNLIVGDIGSGTTAANLGIAASVAGNTLTGSNLVSLSGSSLLSSLNDNNGVNMVQGVPDFTIALADNSSFAVQLGSATTMQDVLNAINNNSQNGGKLTATLSGAHLVLTDHTSGSASLTVAALNGSGAAKDLGILGTAPPGGVLTGGQIISGLDTVLLKDLNGGSGITTPGKIHLTDRSGATATVDLTNAATLADVTTAINGAGLKLSAAVNAAGDGIQLNDTSGQTASNLIVADVGGGSTATNLHLTANVAANSVNTGDLNLRYISTNTQLSQLNGGAGIQRGKFQIVDSSGKGALVDLTGTNINTVGDVITAINTSGAGVRASINTTGDGILLTDIAGGAGTMTVTDQGGTTAASLRLAGGAVGGKIDGAFRYTVAVSASDTLSTLQQSLLNSGAPVTTNILNDGSSSQPYHIMIGSTQSGQAGKLLIDTAATGLSLSTLTPATDAAIQVGAGAGSNLLFTSSTNTFSNILPGLTINVTGTSSTPATVTVGQDTSALVNAIQNFVSDFNTVSGTIAQDTAYDPTSGQGGILQSDINVEQINSTIMNLVTGYAGGATDRTRSLLQMGITLSNGQLTVNAGQLQAAIAGDPTGVQDFLGNATTGMATQLNSALQNYTTPFTGTLAQRTNTLTQQIADQQSRITFLNGVIASKQTQLQSEFASMEQALSTIQSQGSMLTQLANLANFNANYASGSSGSSGSKSG